MEPKLDAALIPVYDNYMRLVVLKVVMLKIQPLRKKIILKCILKKQISRRHTRDDHNVVCSSLGSHSVSE